MSARDAVRAVAGDPGSYPVLIPAVGLLAVGVRAGIGWTSWDTLIACGKTAGVVAVAVAVLALFCRSGAVSAGRGRRTPVAHLHGGLTREVIARHEAGHAVAARALRGKVVKARMYSGNSGGYVIAQGLDTLQSELTFLMAGEIAAGTSQGASCDRTWTRRLLRQVPSSERSTLRRAAERDAHRIVSTSKSEIARDAARLERTGRLSR